MAETFLNVSDLTKAFGPTVALRHVSFQIAAGETVGLVGENGAGKSTLMKVLGGVIAPDSGTISINGNNYPALTVKQSMEAGIAFVHQELNLFENLSVAANIFIGREATYGGKFRLLDDANIEERSRPLLAQLGADIAPDALVENLSLAQRQLVEIAKSLSLKAKLLILDEPTSSLTQRETEKLLDVVQKLSQSGVATIFISHRLGEVEHACKRVVASGATLELIELLEQAGPYGQSHPAPVFVFPSHRVLYADATGTDHIRCTVAASDGTRLKAIAFRAMGTALGELLLSERSFPLHIAGRLVIDEWGNKRQPSLQIEDAAPVK